LGCLWCNGEAVLLEDYSHGGNYHQVQNALVCRMTCWVLQPQSIHPISTIKKHEIEKRVDREMQLDRVLFENLKETEFCWKP
jgi:hypothetical protein